MELRKRNILLLIFSTFLSIIICISLHINIFQINNQTPSNYSYNYYTHS